MPFEGGGPATLSFLGGNVGMLVGTSPTAWPTWKAKRMFPVAVASEKRSPICPDVPTLKEKGWDVVLAQWRGVLAPKGTPPDRVRTLADAFQKALATDTWKAFRERTKSVDAVPGPRPSSARSSPPRRTDSSRSWTSWVSGRSRDAACEASQIGYAASSGPVERYFPLARRQSLS